MVNINNRRAHAEEESVAIMKEKINRKENSKEINKRKTYLFIHINNYIYINDNSI